MKNSKAYKKAVKAKTEDGFTLVEVLVALAIIGIMTTVVVVNLLPETGKARLQKAKSDIRIIEQALEMYHLDILDYPEEDAGLEALRGQPSGVDAARYRQGGYVKLLPNDPWGNPYVYRYPGDNGVFDLLSYGADGEEGGEGLNADIVNWQ